MIYTLEETISKTKSICERLENIKEEIRDLWRFGYGDKIRMQSFGSYCVSTMEKLEDTMRHLAPYADPRGYRSYDPANDRGYSREKPNKKSKKK